MGKGILVAWEVGRVVVWRLGYRRVSSEGRMPGLIQRIARLALASLAMAAVAGSATAIAAQPAPPAVWFGPANDSPDYMDLFAHPERWSQARSKVGVFLLSPAEVEKTGNKRPNSLQSLGAANAFRLLRSWNIAIGIESPAVKEWDCDAATTPKKVIGYIKNVHDYGGLVRYIDIDEPLISGFGLNKPVCKLSMDQIADRLAAYAQNIQTNKEVTSFGPAPQIVDIEAYPTFSVLQLRNWIDLLLARHVRLAALHLDVNVHYLDRKPELQKSVPNDLRNLQSFLKQRGIPFGVIFWSGYSPIRSDSEYAAYVKKWVAEVHSAIGSSDESIFESWVTRCSATGECKPPTGGCSASDPTFCGKQSVPINLPESNPTSHTGILLDSLKMLGSR